MRSCSVSSVSSGATATATLGEDRTIVQRLGRDVHRAPGLGDTRLQRLGDGVPALEGRQQARVRIQDPSGVCEVKGPGHDRAEAGHRHEIDVARLQRLREFAGEALSIEAGREAAELLARDEQRLDPGPKATSSARQRRSEATSATSSPSRTIASKIVPDRTPTRRAVRRPTSTAP